MSHGTGRASFDTHIMRYCPEPRLYLSRDASLHPELAGEWMGYGRCRGHRIERTTFPPMPKSAWFVARRATRNRPYPARPLDFDTRADNYERQNAGRRGLTARQLRQLRRMEARKPR